jgi:hypothetical protein
MASSYTATDAATYERFTGRWRGRLAEELIAFAGIDGLPHGRRAVSSRNPSRPGDHP